MAAEKVGVLRLAQHSLRMIEEGFAETFIGATG
jgi:hypothetical protein